MPPNDRNRVPLGPYATPEAQVSEITQRIDRAEQGVDTFRRTVRVRPGTDNGERTTNYYTELDVKAIESMGSLVAPVEAVNADKTLQVTVDGVVHSALNYTSGVPAVGDYVSMSWTDEKMTTLVAKGWKETPVYHPYAYATGVLRVRNGGDPFESIPPVGNMAIDKDNILGYGVDAVFSVGVTTALQSGTETGLQTVHGIYVTVGDAEPVLTNIPLRKETPNSDSFIVPLSATHLEFWDGYLWKVGRGYPVNEGNENATRNASTDYRVARYNPSSNAWDPIFNGSAGYPTGVPYFGTHYIVMPVIQRVTSSTAALFAFIAKGTSHVPFLDGATVPWGQYVPRPEGTAINDYAAWVTYGRDGVGVGIACKPPVPNAPWNFVNGNVTGSASYSSSIGISDYWGELYDDLNRVKQHPWDQVDYTDTPAYERQEPNEGGMIVADMLVNGPCMVASNGDLCGLSSIGYPSLRDQAQGNASYYRFSPQGVLVESYDFVFSPLQRPVPMPRWNTIRDIHLDEVGNVYAFGSIDAALIGMWPGMGMFNFPAIWRLQDFTVPHSGTVVPVFQLVWVAHELDFMAELAVAANPTHLVDPIATTFLAVAATGTHQGSSGASTYHKYTEGDVYFPITLSLSDLDVLPNLDPLTIANQLGQTGAQ